MIAVAVIIGLYAILDSTAPRGVPFWIVAYAGSFTVIVATLAGGVMMRDEVRWRRGSSTLLALWLAIGIAWYLPILLDEIFYINYALGDFVAMVLYPVVIYVAGMQDQALFRSNRTLALLAGFLGFACLIAPFTTTLWGESYARGIGDARYDPPSFALIALAWAAFWTVRGLPRVLIAAALGGIFALALFSQERTAIILWLAIGGLTALVTRTVTRIAAIAMGGALLVVALLVILPGNVLAPRLQSVGERTRLSRFEGGVDPSLLGRAFEAIDVTNRIANDPRGVPVLVGYGHGATFQPVLGHNEHNETEDERIHTVHIGPFLLLHRYGLLGVAVYVVLLVTIVRQILFMRSRRETLAPEQLRVQLFFTAAILATSMEFWLRNTQNDPVVSFIIAGFLYNRMHREDVEWLTPE